MLGSTSSPGGAPQDPRSDDLAWLEELSDSTSSSEDVAPGSWLDSVLPDISQEPTVDGPTADTLQDLPVEGMPAEAAQDLPADELPTEVPQDLPAVEPTEGFSRIPQPDDARDGDVPEDDLPSMREELRSLSPVASFKVLRGAFRQWRKEHSIFLRVLFNIVRSLIVVAAAAVLIVTLVLPILRISGDSMTDTLEDRDIVVALRGSDCETGDVIAFYYNNKILVKRVIAGSGQWVDIDREGNVFVDGVRIDEPYVTDRSLGDCNIKLPYQVPEDRLFVMGDHRSTSIDSRNTAVGCVSDEQIVGKLMFCAWPITHLGGID